MNPLYFGSRRRLLFGVYHPPTGRPVEPVGIVVCPPLALEYMRAYRALRQLSVQLAEKGFHVFRFDYHGTGDSGGQGGGETLEGWKQDVETAMQELGDLSGVTRFSLVGVRFGAVLATRAAAGAKTVEDLVFWDPAVRGRRHLRWLVRGVDGPSRSRALRQEAPPDRDPEEDNGVIGAEGFPMAFHLLREIGAADLADPAVAKLPLRRVLVASSSAEEVSPLVASLEQGRMEHTVRILPDEIGWEDPARQGSIALAPRATRELVDSMTSDEGGP